MLRLWWRWIMPKLCKLVQVLRCSIWMQWPCLILEVTNCVVDFIARLCHLPYVMNFFSTGLTHVQNKMRLKCTERHQIGSDILKIQVDTVKRSGLTFLAHCMLLCYLRIWLLNSYSLNDEIFYSRNLQHLMACTCASVWWTVSRVLEKYKPDALPGATKTHLYLL